MKKKFSCILLLTVLLVSTTAACSSATEPSAAEPTEQPTEDPAAVDAQSDDVLTEAVPEEIIIELRVLNYVDVTSETAQADMEALWEEFEEANPNIKIIRQDEAGEAYHQAVDRYIAANELPDVIYTWPSGPSTLLHTQKLLKDLTPLIERDGLADTFYPSALDPAGQAAGYQAMLPLGSSAASIFMINHEVLRAVGLEPAQTYSELVAQVPILRSAGYETVLMTNLSDWVMQSCLFSLVAGRFCGDGWDQKILNGEASFTDPDFVAALGFIEQMYEDGVISRDTLAFDYAEGPGLFAGNTAAYYIDGDWSVQNFLTDPATGEALISAERQANFDIGIFPEIDTEGVAIPAAANAAQLEAGWGIHAGLEDDSPELEAAWTLVQWLTGKEAQEILLRSGQINAPSRNDVDLAFLSLEPLQISLVEMLNTDFVATAVIDGVFQASVYAPLKAGLQQIGLDEATPAAVAQLTQEAYEATLQSELTTLQSEPTTLHSDPNS